MLQSSYAFWSANWRWAAQETSLKVSGPYRYAVTGKNRVLGFALEASIRRTDRSNLVWEFELHAPGTARDVIGGGVAFKFDRAAFASALGKPELLPGNRGWAWGRAGGPRIEMRFDPPVAAVQPPSKDNAELRAFFYQGEVPAGVRRYVATLTVSGGVAIAPSAAERFGGAGQPSWPAQRVEWDSAPVDLSFLNAPDKPAGGHGFLRAAGDGLVFADGTRARFWGTNLTSYALFGTPRDEVVRQARRLSALGFNLVRFHHHDSPWVSPNVFGERSAPDTRHLSAAMLDKLDWWIKCLKDEGIYVWLDLHDGRQLRRADGVEGFAEISKDGRTADLKGYNYVNPSIESAMQRFQDAYVGHRNPYTGLRYADDPAVVAVLITNENDATNHYGNALLPDKRVPWHSARYMTQARAFASTWGLPPDRVWRAWEPGPSKLFLNDLEHRFDGGMIADLRAQGVKVPIATTSTWGSNPLSSLPALTTGDIVDAHAYGGAGELEKNPLYAPNMADWIAAAQVAGRPLSVSEWNVSPFPVSDRYVVPLYLAACGGLQGWDAMLQYAYAQAPLDSAGVPSDWAAFNDPGLLATLPAAALMYRRGDVREARTVYAFAPSPERLFGEKISPGNSAALRTAAVIGRLVVAMPRVRELPWLAASRLPAGAQVITDPGRPLIDSRATGASSDTGELRRNWARGTYTIDTSRTQAAMGWIGGRKIALTDVAFAVETRNAAVAVQSLTSRPIAESRDIMISLGARSMPRSPRKLPFRSEPLAGSLTIRAPGGLRLYSGRDSAAQGSPFRYSPDMNAKARELRVAREGGRYVIDLAAAAGTNWLFLR